jgi:hypothetical protein
MMVVMTLGHGPWLAQHDLQRAIDRGRHEPRRNQRAQRQYRQHEGGQAN